MLLLTLSQMAWRHDNARPGLHLIEICGWRVFWPMAARDSGPWPRQLHHHISLHLPRKGLLHGDCDASPFFTLPIETSSHTQETSCDTNIKACITSITQQVGLRVSINERAGPLSLGQSGYPLCTCLHGPTYTVAGAWISTISEASDLDTAGCETRGGSAVHCPQ